LGECVDPEKPLPPVEALSVVPVLGVILCFPLFSRIPLAVAGRGGPAASALVQVLSNDPSRLWPVFLLLPSVVTPEDTAAFNTIAGEFCVVVESRLEELTWTGDSGGDRGCSHAPNIVDIGEETSDEIVVDVIGVFRDELPG
jgi:hypothetical protein